MSEVEVRRRLFVEEAQHEGEEVLGNAEAENQSVGEPDWAVQIRFFFDSVEEDGGGRVIAGDDSFDDFVLVHLEVL